MENKNNTVLYYSIGAVVIILIIIFWLIGKGKDTTLIEDLGQNVDQTVIIPKDTKKTTVSKKTPIETIEYMEALRLYKDARIQLDKTCQAIPNYVTYKKGTSIMIDNRSPFDRTVKVGSVYTIKAYDFKIVKLSDSPLPRIWLVDCDGSENVASILIQN